MENAVVQQIRKRITRSKFGEIFFVSSFPQYDVEYVTKLLAIFEKEGLITRIAKGVYVKARKTRFGILYPSAYELVKEISKRDKAKVIPNLLRVILFLICCTTAFSIDFVYKLWSE